MFLADSQKLEEMVRELSQMLTSVKHEQEYMEVRERVHRSSKSIWRFTLVQDITRFYFSKVFKDPFSRRLSPILTSYFQSMKTRTAAW